MSKTVDAGLDVIAEIEAYNAGRDADLLARKYAKMADSPFIFLRGACHLFYAALPKAAVLEAAPLAWSCGDLHFENFGSYKGDNRQVYFDINDFDEAALAPASWDVLRLLTSIECGPEALFATPAQARGIRQNCLDAYCRALSLGKPRWVERGDASGLVGTLLEGLQKRKRADFIAKRTVLEKGRLRLKLDPDKILPASAAQRDAVTGFMQAFAATQPQADFFQVLDSGRRVAGTGSLGLPRFVVLVEGKGEPGGNYLLDLKQARASALAPALTRRAIAQPAWPDQALRVVTVQRRMQAVDHAFLHAVTMAGAPCILRELQPSEDRVEFALWKKDIGVLEEAVATMGRALAWDQLRASGRDGAANADALIAFGQRGDWQADMLEAATLMTQATRRQWELFVKWRRQSVGGAA